MTRHALLLLLWILSLLPGLVSGQSFEVIYTPPAGIFNITEVDLSADGSTIVGTYLDNGASGNDVFVIKDGEVSFLKAGRQSIQNVIETSADGSVIIAGTRDIWTDGDHSLQGQIDLPDNARDEIVALSADGNTSVGIRVSYDPVLV